MRFDDMIATALAQPADTSVSRLAKWRQLVDLLAQPRDLGGSREARAALAWIAEEGRTIPVDRRRPILLSLVGRSVNPLFIDLIADEHPSIVAPLFASCRLPTEDWIALLPRLGPLARGLLRHRRDLDPSIQRALGAFGAADFALSGTVGNQAADPGETQIRDLVARIEAYRRNRPPPVPARSLEEPASENFQWESITDGTILWVEGVPRGAIVGQSIAVIAEPAGHGVDGQAAGAFQKRSPFRDARFTIAGSGAAAGDWRISGVPHFDPARGTFLGYRGTGRRPRADEVARPERNQLFGAAVPADSLRQLIHELRTPLNAILGFAEMIDGQYLGPASQSYRHRAEDIMRQAGRLLMAVEDLDTAARLETRRCSVDAGPVDAASLVARLSQDLQPVMDMSGARLIVAIAPDLPPARLGEEAAERMIARLLSSAIGLAGGGEDIRLALAGATRDGKALLRLDIDRPRIIAGLEEQELLDPGYSPDGDWPDAPMLGLGFALRLVRNIAESVGGMLEIGPARLSLYLPVDQEAGRRDEHSL